MSNLCVSNATLIDFSIPRFSCIDEEAEAQRQELAQGHTGGESQRCWLAPKTCALATHYRIFKKERRGLVAEC